MPCGYTVHMNTMAKMSMRGQEGEGRRAEARPTVAQQAYAFLAWRTRASDSHRPLASPGSALGVGYPAADRTPCADTSDTKSRGIGSYKRWSDWRDIFWMIVRDS